MGTRFVQEVPRLILATQHDGKPGSPDAQLLCDIDISILGAPPARYMEYSKAIREEYGWVANGQYVEGRRKVLESFLLRSPLFHLGAFEDKFARQAKLNLEDELGGLG